MDELNKQNIGEETAAAHPVGENTQPVPPAGTGAQQAQQPEGEGTTAPEHSWASWSARAAAMRLNQRKKVPALRHEEQFEAVQDLRRDDCEKRKALPEVRSEE